MATPRQVWDHPRYGGIVKGLVLYTLMIELGGGWVPANYAEYDETSQAFTYDWDEGYYPY